MDNNNPNNQFGNMQPPPPQVPPQAPAPQPVAAEQSPDAAQTKVTPMESIKIRISEIKQSMGFGNKDRIKKILIALVALVFILILITAGYALLPKQVATPLATLTPTPVGTELPRGEPSEYANDPEVLRILDALKAFDQEAEKTIIREDDLRLPSVDWNISF